MKGRIGRTTVNFLKIGAKLPEKLKKNSVDPDQIAPDQGLHFFIPPLDFSVLRDSKILFFVLDLTLIG